MGVLGYWDGLNFITWKGFITFPSRESAQDEFDMIKWNDKNNCNEEPSAKGAFITELA
jgi:hypothetical protein